MNTPIERYEILPPYDDETKESVCYVREIDTLMLKSMPSGSIDIMLSHDWPRGITRYGDEDQLLKRRGHLRKAIRKNELGSPPGMEILKKLLPPYWFAAHLHVDFEANYERKTKFLALDRCISDWDESKYLKIISHESHDW